MEQFIVQLSESDPAVVLNINTANVTIVDEDGRQLFESKTPLHVDNLHLPCPTFPVLTIALAMSSYSVDEGEAVTVCANVVNGSLARNLTFSFSTTMGSATGIHR